MEIAYIAYTIISVVMIGLSLAALVYGAYLCFSCMRRRSRLDPKNWGSVHERALDIFAHPRG